MINIAKPIRFNTHMVRATLDGNKTCTRQIIKKKYSNVDIKWLKNKHGKKLVFMQNDESKPLKNSNGTTTHSLIAIEEIDQLYKVGQLLYVKETWCDRWLPDGYLEGNQRYGYKADCIDSTFSYGHGVS